jgi:hypothetical protein
MSKKKKAVGFQPPDYSNAALGELKRLARVPVPRLGLRPGYRVQQVCHLLPRAMCVAKTAPLFAVFSVPVCDCEIGLLDRARDGGTVHVAVQDTTASDVAVGDWCALAYIYTACGHGSLVVVRKLCRGDEGANARKGKSCRR